MNIAQTHSVSGNKMLRDRLRKIRLIAFDFDGVFTDNMVYTFEDGREAVRCFRGDGIGLKKLRQKNVQAIIASSETNPVVSARAAKLGVRCLQGMSDKRSAIERIVLEQNLTWVQVAFVGNDVNDVDCLRAAGAPMVVQDAHAEVIPLAIYQTKAAGGHGAVREICDLIVDALGRDTH
jgi:YrbI family 3-deoxy-D-manno-octulosonate 8-phosphate phosphatase